MFVLPLAMDETKETQYVSIATLKKAVDIDELAVMDYTYNGIAEKEGSFLWMDSIEYRVKYEAHIQANCKLSDMQFEEDKDANVVIAYLPDLQISDPVLNESSFGYLPEDVDADIRDVLSLCKEDAANEVDMDALHEEASESLRLTVTELLSPLLTDGRKLEIRSLAEYEGQNEAQNESE